jgi:hypothetical protein
LRIHRMAFQLPVNWFPQLQSLHLVGQFLPHELLLSFSWKTLPILESLSIHFSEESNFGDSCPENTVPSIAIPCIGRSPCGMFEGSGPHNRPGGLWTFTFDLRSIFYPTNKLDVPTLIPLLQIPRPIIHLIRGFRSFIYLPV